MGDKFAQINFSTEDDIHLEIDVILHGDDVALHQIEIYEKQNKIKKNRIKPLSLSPDYGRKLKYNSAQNSHPTTIGAWPLHFISPSLIIIYELRSSTRLLNEIS